MSDYRTLRRVLPGALVTLVLALGACSADTGSAPAEPAAASPSADRPYTVVSAPSLAPGDDIPAPTDAVVLTVDGVSDAPVELDMATLESMGLVEYAADDKQALGRTATFRGVLLSTLLDTVGAEDATNLRTTAVNDYSVEIPAADAEELPVLLATSVDGERMDIESYGPLRVVYPTEGVELDATVYDPRWIWQLTDITVE